MLGCDLGKRAICCFGAVFCGKVEMLGVFVVPGRFVVPDILNGFPKGGRGALATFPILGDV